MLLNFKKPTLQDSDRLHQILRKNRHQGCEFSISNLILWSDFYHTEYAVLNDILIIRTTDADGTSRLSYPIGAVTEKQEQETFALELKYFNEWGQAPLFGLITPLMFECIDRWYPGRFQIEYHRDWADYIYDREKMIHLSGKKLHGKRNHIKRFTEQHPEWSYESLTEENVAECIEMAKEWCRLNCYQEDDEKEEEAHLVNRALRNFRQLHMKGGLLRIQEGIVAFTLGSAISQDTFDVSFEKAFSSIQGAYPMINQQFVMHELQDYAYVNREEDLGIEGLRKAKLSYYPEILLGKGIVQECL